MLLAGVAIEHVEDGKGRDEAIVIAAADRRVEEIVARLLEARERAQRVDAALDVGVAGLPIIGLDAIGDQHRIGREQAGRLHVDDEGGVRMQRREIARQHDADLVGEDLLALIVDDAAAIAIAIEAEPDFGAMLQHRIADRVQHLHVFGVGIVAREGVVELGIERDHLGADHLERLGRESAGRAIAAGGDHLDRPAELRPVGHVGHVDGREILVELVGAAAGQIEGCAASTISFSRLISSGPKVSGRAAPIFTPVQPFSLCEAVTMATAGTSSSNCAK